MKHFALHNSSNSSQRTDAVFVNKQEKYSRFFFPFPWNLLLTCSSDGFSIESRGAQAIGSFLLNSLLFEKIYI